MKNLLILIAACVCSAASAQSYAFSLNGTNSFLEIPDNNAIDFSNSFTMEAWIYPTGNGSQPVQGGMIFNKEDSYELARFEDGTIQFALDPTGSGGGWTWINTGLVAPIGQWSHVAFIKSGSNVVVYLNAASSYSSNTQPASLTTNTSSLRIGNRTNMNVFFQGYIDNVRLWNVARTQSELKYAIFGQDIFANTAGLVINFPFGTNAGTTITNSSTNISGLNANIIGTAAWTNSPIRFSANAVALDGFDDYVGTALSMSNFTRFTMEGWINLRSTTGTMSFFGQNDMLEFGLYGTNDIRGWSRMGAEVGWTFTSAELDINSWHHLAFVGNGTQLLLYVDGVQRAAVPLNVGSYGSSSDRFNIGAGVWSPAGLPVNGLMDEIRVWNVARTQSEIQNNMSTEIDPVSATGLVAYYKFNGGIPGGNNTGLNLVVDHKGNNNGTLFNASLSGTSSNFIQQSSIAVLPVQWKSFDAELNNEDVLLTWTTAEENNSRDFVVQHSINGTDWNSLTVLTAAGNSDVDQHYSYLHQQAGVGLHYYRIQQRDVDGRSSYSNVQRVRIASTATSFRILGNPVQNHTIRVQTNQSGTAVLYNAAGQRMAQQLLLPGTSTISVQALPKGYYMLSFQGQTETVYIP